jgi:hypothetical protein
MNKKLAQIYLFKKVDFQMSLIAWQISQLFQNELSRKKISTRTIEEKLPFLSLVALPALPCLPTKRVCEYL